ncbi:MAG TPA: hypothetical protein VGZ22_21745, partial [Isosphaeraceae bacterium]|nr:hypothetical protein [Isosphaeraceae bacterium]
MPEPRPQAGSTPRWAVFAVLLGVYLSVHGYQSFEVDQAYRLPLLLHRQDASLYANDPFVRAFDTFNPHIGYVALLDVISRLVGLSAALAGLYFVMFGVAAAGIDRLARSVWPAAGSRVGFVAMGLVLLARAGNIGTNHLFESMLLDRGMAFALGWVALGSVVDRPDRGGWLAALAIGLAGLIHPSVGMQLAMLLAATWVVWGFLRTRTGVEPKRAVVGIGWIVVAMIPCVWLHAGQQGRLLEGLPAEEFRLLSVFVQSPQHMLPHLWLTPQWLAWACYPILAVLALWDRGEVGKGSWPAARVRLAAILAVNLVGLAAAWFAIEEVHNLRVTVFQPFRMATVLRGLALIPLAGRVLMLWQRGDRLSRVRATLLAVGLTGDWSLVVVTAVELTMVATSGVPAGSLVSMAVLAGSLVFLSRHDTESGHWRLLAGLGVILAYDGLMRRATRQTRTMPRPHLVLGGPDSLRGREVPLEIGHQGSQRSLRRLLRLRRPDKQVVRASLDEAIAGRGCLGDEEIREGEAPAEPSMAPAARQEPRPP